MGPGTPAMTGIGAEQMAVADGSWLLIEEYAMMPV